MCNRFTLRARLNRILQDMDVEGGPEWSARYNVAPTQSIPVVRLNDEHRRECTLMRWGLIPSWANDPKALGNLFNARSETVASKPSFRTAFKKRRGLIIADGWYEWQALGKIKQPYFFRMKDDAPFTFAGLWEYWCGDDKPVESCTIVTTAANELGQPLHDRMPVILSSSDRDAWLDPASTPDELQPLLRPFPPELMIVGPVNRIVNSYKHDGPECIAPVAIE